MKELNHFAISAALGSTLGPSLTVHHGQLGSLELAGILSNLLRVRRGFVDALNPRDDVARRYEKAVTQAFVLVRNGFSSDRVLADPDLDAKFIKACHDLGVDDTVFRLNLALVGLRKHSKLKLGKSIRTVVHDQWRYAVASEIAARVMHYRYGASVDTTLSHPVLVKEFDALASGITPGFSSFEYRWAALNVRKKGANANIKPRVINELEWSPQVTFDAFGQLPAEEGIYTLFERDTCLFVAGTEDIQESVQSQQTIVEANLFEPRIWRPDPDQLSWRYVGMPDRPSDYRFGVVRCLIGQWQPVFNIPRGAHAA